MAGDNPIDFVIPWVNGEDPDHVALRRQYQQSAGFEVADEVNAARRWSDAGEIRICLSSIAAHAPWVRKVWVITNGQQPPLEDLSEHFRKKIEVVGHERIFHGHDACLPTFNSLAIGTAAWRLEGLADRFVYFNDDTFLLGDIKPQDFFIGDDTILRGKWQTSDPAEYVTKIYRSSKLNAAAMAGFGPDRWFSLAHCPIAMDKRILADFFARSPDALAANLSHRFRDGSQFSISSLFAHLALRANRANFPGKKDWKTFDSTWCESASARDLFAALILNKLKWRKLVCINDLAPIVAGRSRLTRLFSSLISA
ncbi:Stealth CR1 domain-containing protein [Croceicoccus naphthovorans]|nr:Stealth CR1 domain-containing protein [Croceicoccus naphthovorans]MBB3989688.1 hypothetical protein [Croceicoccus naphthovorans]